MLIKHHRQKLINAIIYFANNTKYCGKTKLFKLLYFLDFEHFKQTGRSVTNLEYYAWRMGPVPIALYDEFDAPQVDLQNHVNFVPTLTSIFQNEMIQINPLKDFDSDHFSKREMEIMEELAKEFYAKKANEMIEATHLEKDPWDRVFRIEMKPRALIPYEYALNSNGKNYELIENYIKDNKEMQENYA